MSFDPIDTALRQVSDAKLLVERLIVSSEQFDYLQARKSLDELEKKARELSRTKAKLEAIVRKRKSVIQVVDFKAPHSKPSQAGGGPGEQ